MYNNEELSINSVFSYEHPNEIRIKNVLNQSSRKYSKDNTNIKKNYKK